MGSLSTSHWSCENIYSSHKMWILPVILFFSAAWGFERQMNVTKNPGCEKLDILLYHVTAQGPNDTLHYIWDFTKRTRPSIFLAVTDNNSSLSVDCFNFTDGFPNSFSFTNKPKYEFFLIINKLIEFNDVNDTGILTAQSPRISYDTKFFTWTPTEEAKEDDGSRFVSLQVTGTHFNESDLFVGGNFSIQLGAFGFENHDDELPRLLHSPNSTQCRITLENMISNSGFNESRFAFELVLVSSDDRKKSSKISTRKNLDDENSPGIFSMVDVMTPKAQNQLFEGAFLQWRPIIYLSKVPSLADSSEAVAYNLTEVGDPSTSLKDSLPYKYYGDELNSVLVEQTVVSLGMAQDGFYKKSNFSSWTFLVNYGSPEEEKFSLLVILVMCIGLGLPALLILIGGIYMCARRIRRSKDELSLERAAVSGSNEGPPAGNFSHQSNTASLRTLRRTPMSLQACDESIVEYHAGGGMEWYHN